MASGTLDVETLSGDIQVRIGDMMFAPDGLQPVDLSALATLPFPVSGMIGGHADIVIKNGAPQVRGQIQLRDGAGAMDATTTDKVNARIDAEWQGGETPANISVDVPSAVVRHGDISVLVSPAMLEANIHPTSKTATVNIEDLNLQHLSAAPSATLFPPLHLSGEGFFQNTEARISLSVDALNGLLSAVISGKADTVEQSGTARLTLSPLTFDPDGLQPGALSSMLKVPASISGTTEGSVDISVHEGKPEVKAALSLTGGGGHLDGISIRDTNARVTAHWPDADGRVDISANVSNPSISHASDTLFIPSVKLRASVDPTNNDAALHISDLHLRHLVPDPLVKPLRGDGRVKIKDGKADFTMTVVLDTPPPAQHIMSAAGIHDVSGGKGQATVSIGDIVFDPAALKPSDISPLLSQLPVISGRLSARSQLAWSAAGLTGSGQLKVIDLTAKTDTVSINNINTDLKLVNLWPPRTDRPQSLQAETVTSTVSLIAPHLSFSIGGNTPGTNPTALPAVLLHNFNAGFIGGEVSIKDLRFEPDAKTHNVAVDLRHIDLKSLLAIIEIDGVAGTGSISGTVPLMISANDVEIKDGLLNADGPGVLQFRSEQAKQALSGGGEQVDLLLSVLDDFHYATLSLAIDRERSGSANLKLKLSGHNPAVMDGHSFNLNINLEGNADNLIAALLEAFRLSDSAIRATVGSTGQ